MCKANTGMTPAECHSLVEKYLSYSSHDGDEELSVDHALHEFVLKLKNYCYPRGQNSTSEFRHKDVF